MKPCKEIIITGVASNHNHECTQLLPTNSTKSVHCLSWQLVGKISIKLLTRAYQVLQFYQAKLLRVPAITHLEELSMESHNSRLLKWVLDQNWVPPTKSETSEFLRKDCWCQLRQITLAVEITQMGLETLPWLLEIDLQLKAFQKHKWAKIIKMLIFFKQVVATIY